MTTIHIVCLSGSLFLLLYMYIGVYNVHTNWIQRVSLGRKDPVMTCALSVLFGAENLLFCEIMFQHFERVT